MCVCVWGEDSLVVMVFDSQLKAADSAPDDLSLSVGILEQDNVIPHLHLGDLSNLRSL